MSSQSASLYLCSTDRVLPCHWKWRHSIWISVHCPFHVWYCIRSIEVYTTRIRNRSYDLPLPKLLVYLTCRSITSLGLRKSFMLAVIFLIDSLSSIVSHTTLSPPSPSPLPPPSLPPSSPLPPSQQTMVTPNHDRSQNQKGRRGHLSQRTTSAFWELQMERKRLALWLVQEK